MEKLRLHRQSSRKHVLKTILRTAWSTPKYVLQYIITRRLEAACSPAADPPLGIYTKFGENYQNILTPTPFFFRSIFKSRAPEAACSPAADPPGTRRRVSGK